MLMGSYIRQQAASGQSRRLEQALQHLQDPAFRLQVSLPQTDTYAHPSLSAEDVISLTTLISVSNAALPNDTARHALRTLGCFPPKPNSFSEAAATAVMDQPVEMLDALVDAGLVEPKGHGRVQLHQAIADYLSTTERPSTVAHRFVQYYAGWLAAEQDDAAIEMEVDNLLTAISLATETEQTPALISLTADLLPFLEKQSLWDLVDQLTPQAATLAQKTGDYATAVMLLHRLSRSFDVRLDHDKADHYLAQALGIARRHQQTKLLVSILSERSLVASSKDDYKQARTYLEEALAAARATGYPRGISMVLGYLGRLSHQSGNHDQTPLYLDEAIAIARKHVFHDLLCGLLILRGAAASYSETAEAAEQHYLEGLELARTVGRKDQLSAILTNLGEIETNRGEVERAIAYLEEALDIVRESGNVAREAHIRKDLGILAMRRGDAKVSQYHFETGLSLAEADENDWLAGYIEVHWAESALQNGDTDRAAQLADQVAARLPDSGKNRSIIAIAHFIQAQLAAERGDWHLAHELAKQSGDSLQTIGHARANEVLSWLEK